MMAFVGSFPHFALADSAEEDDTVQELDDVDDVPYDEFLEALEDAYAHSNYINEHDNLLFVLIDEEGYVYETFEIDSDTGSISWGFENVPFEEYYQEHMG